MCKFFNGFLSICRILVSDWFYHNLARIQAEINKIHHELIRRECVNMWVIRSYTHHGRRTVPYIKHDERKMD